MKAHPTTHALFALAAILGLLAPLRASDTQKPAPRTEVVFDNPDSFTDWKLSTDPWYRDSVFSAVRSYLAKVANPMLPDGYSLRITITDIDLGHRASLHIPSNSGAPAFDFTYSVTDPSGKVVRTGTEDLRHYWDFGNYRYSVETTDILTQVIQHEKPMLKDWACTKLAGLAKA
jgi:Protein of unknown function (DUF3016)